MYICTHARHDISKQVDLDFPKYMPCLLEMERQLMEEDSVTENTYMRSWPELRVPLGRQLRKQREKDLRPNGIRVVKVQLRRELSNELPSFVDEEILFNIFG